jgi:hypothetical protein
VKAAVLLGTLAAVVALSNFSTAAKNSGASKRRLFGVGERKYNSSSAEI